MCTRKTSKAYEVYGEETIHERHRHRYEVNNDYRNVLVENGMKLSGISPDGRIVEMVEVEDHPWFLATQAHPELKSRPNDHIRSLEDSPQRHWNIRKNTTR